MTKPLYTIAAIEDLESILEFIAKDKPGAAVGWVARIEDKCVAIASNPETGQQMPHLGYDVRASVLGRYMIFHRFVGGRVEILRVIPAGPEVTSL
ncbi:MAG: type II toxin-antitoxin system RelE/ParE family toxin [Pirellulaceae bacterium]|nr:type II toxin-antitoxin system RelE/ParE family toxin [Pirellulaceae bacterium]